MRLVYLSQGNFVTSPTLNLAHRKDKEKGWGVLISPGQSSLDVPISDVLKRSELTVRAWGRKWKHGSPALPAKVNGLLTCGLSRWVLFKCTRSATTGTAIDHIYLCLLAKVTVALTD